VLPAGLRDAIRGIWTRRNLRELVERLVPPWNARVSGARGSPARADCTIAYLSNGGQWKLFDLDGGRVWTLAPNVERTRRDLAKLDRFRHAFNIPAGQLVAEGDSLWRCDAYMDCPNLAQCDAARRSELVRRLIAQYAAFAASAGEPPRLQLTLDALDTLADIAPTSLAARIAQRHRPALEGLGRELPLAPVHGDLSAQNVFVCDGEPWIIDWDDSGESLPLLMDVLYLFVREAALSRVDLLEAFLEGRFDAEIGRAFRACGAPSLPRDNLLLVLHAYLVRLHVMRRSGRRDANGRNVESLWNRLRGYCKGYL
jgi:hypothetical protein